MKRIALLFLLTAATAYALHCCVVRPYRCARAASAGARALDRVEMRPDYLQPRVANEITRTLQDCDCVTNIEIPYTLARAASLQRDPHAAVAHAQRALDLDRRPEIYVALGLAYLDLLDRNAAIANLARAAEFDPSRLDDIPYADVREETRRRIGTAHIAGGQTTVP